MDPEATLSALLSAGSYPEALQAACDLLTWLAGGGTRPTLLATRMIHEAPALLDRLEKDADSRHDFIPAEET